MRGLALRNINLRWTLAARPLLEVSSSYIYLYRALELLQLQPATRSMLFYHHISPEFRIIRLVSRLGTFKLDKMPHMSNHIINI